MAQVIEEIGRSCADPRNLTHFLFHLAEFQKQDTKKLYQEFWATFDTDKQCWRGRSGGRPVETVSPQLIHE